MYHPHSQPQSQHLFSVRSEAAYERVHPPAANCSRRSLCEPTIATQHQLASTVRPKNLHIQYQCWPQSKNLLIELEKSSPAVPPHLLQTPDQLCRHIPKMKAHRWRSLDVLPGCYRDETAKLPKSSHQRAQQANSCYRAISISL